MTLPRGFADRASRGEETHSATARWLAIEALLHEVIDKSPSERRHHLDLRCTDASMRAEVEALVAAHEVEGRLDALMRDVMSPLVGTREYEAPEPISTPGSIVETLTIHARYRILQRLGGGGMGVVYRARDERLERDVALKFLPPHLSADQAAKKRFLVEARAAAALEHPNICTVHEIGDTDDGQLYIVMACYDGETVDRHIARGPLGLRDALRIAAEVARGLGKAHERGIIHRDIKPANVIVTADGQVKILDFGIAKLTDANATHTVGAVGTIAYMSPEQAFGDTVDHRSDIWSLGVVLYEMLTGLRPFRGPGEQAVLFGALAAEPDPVTSVRSDVPAEVDAIVRRALAKRPTDRFGSAAEMLAAVTGCAERLDGASPHERAAAPTATSQLTRGGERRQVAAVVCEIAGYDRLVERLSPDEGDAVLARIRDAAVDVATHYGGIVNRFLGDAFTMLFGVPTAHEDDALRAVRAALVLRDRMAEIAASLAEPVSSELGLRAGVHIAPGIAQRLRAGDQRYRITGAPLEVAARLADTADADTILMTPEARRAVGPFIHTIESSAVSITSSGGVLTPYRVLGPSSVRSRLEGAADTGLTPFVGRERERATLAEHLDRARTGNGGVTLLVGEAGVGKSRLVVELRGVAATAGMRVLVGRCDAYGGTTPFLPFVDATHDALALRRDAGPRERHDTVVATASAVDPSLEELVPLYLALLAIPSETHSVPPHLRGELFQGAMLEAIAALFTLGARSTPTLLLLEDWHWADEASRAALRQLAEIVSGFPLLVVVTARPEGSDDLMPINASNGTGAFVSLLHLAPLDAAASAAIACAVFGADGVAPELGARLHDRTGGNPFFLEELCESLREAEEVVVRDGVAVSASDDEGGLDPVVRVPATVRGVLRTRIDRLDDEARDVLRTASVIGRLFTRGVVEDAVPCGAPSTVARALDRLKASGLVQQVGVAPEALYRFKHALTQEVAYESLLEHQRATLHAAVGHAIERRYGAHLDEHVERLAHHFSRAEAWANAVRYGLQAADRATALSQNADALATLERVEQWVLRLPGDSSRSDLHADVLLRQERLCEALGLRSRQLGLVESLIAILAPNGASERLARAYLRQGDVFTLLRRFEAAERSLATSLRIATERGDGDGERHALRSIALLRSHQGRHAEALANIEHVLELGRAAGDTRAEAGDLATMANTLRAMGQPERALAAVQAALDRTVAADNPVRYGALLNVMGMLYRDMGEYDLALEHLRRVSEHTLEPRHPVNASFTLPAIAQILLQQGRVEEALATYRRGLELTRKARHADGLAHACRSLGEVLLGLGREAEASPFLREAASLFAQLEDHANEGLMWRRLATAQERLDQPAEAHTSWARARELQHRIENVTDEAEAVEGMARTERRLGVATPEVVARYEEALTLAVRLGDRKREIAVRNALGIVHWQAGHYHDAVREYEAALRLCREDGDRPHEALILNSLGSTLYRLRRWDEAQTALSEGLHMAEATGEQELAAQARRLLGRLARRQ